MPTQGEERERSHQFRRRGGNEQDGMAHLSRGLLTNKPILVLAGEPLVVESESLDVGVGGDTSLALTCRAGGCDGSHPWYWCYCWWHARRAGSRGV